MKKSQLKSIIRESIKELINEQANSSNITVSPGDVVAVAAAYPIILNPQDLSMNTTQGANPFAYVFYNQPFPGNVYLSSGPSNYAMSSNCGAAKSYAINTQAEADAFNSAMNGENGVYLELASTSNPNASNAAYQATENVMALLNANFQGQVNPSTYTSECYYIGGGTPSTPTSAPASPPAVASIGGVDPDAGFFNPGGSGYAANDPDAFQFPSGFNPVQWVNGWANNIVSFLEGDNIELVLQNICQFLADRITLWTSEYQSAGPLYQNQLVYKLQAAYMLQDYFDCSGAPLDNMQGIFSEGLNEQMEKSLPSNLKATLDQLLQKVDKRVKQFKKGLSKKDPKVDRMQKLAGIPKDKPMDKPEKK